MLSHVRSHAGGTHVLCSVAGMVYPFTTKLKICLNWLLLCPSTPHVYLYPHVFVYRKLFTLCLVPFRMPCDQLSPTGHLIKIGDPEVWVKDAFVWHIIFSLIGDLEIILKRPWFRRTKIGWNWFWYFPEEEFTVSGVYIQRGRREERKNSGG